MYKIFPVMRNIANSFAYQVSIPEPQYPVTYSGCQQQTYAPIYSDVPFYLAFKSITGMTNQEYTKRLLMF